MNVFFWLLVLVVIQFKPLRVRWQAVSEVFVVFPSFAIRISEADRLVYWKGTFHLLLQGRVSARHGRRQRQQHRRDTACQAESRGNVSSTSARIGMKFGSACSVSEKFQ